MKIKELHTKLQQIIVNNIGRNLEFFLGDLPLQSYRYKLIVGDFLQNNLSRFCDLVIYYHYVLKTNYFEISANGQITFLIARIGEEANVLRIFDNFFNNYIMSKIPEINIIRNGRERTDELCPGEYEAKTFEEDVDKHMILTMQKLEHFVRASFSQLNATAVDNWDLAHGQPNLQPFTFWLKEGYTWRQIVASLIRAMGKITSKSYPIYSQFPHLH